MNRYLGLRLGGALNASVLRMQGFDESLCLAFEEEFGLVGTRLDLKVINWLLDHGCPTEQVAVMVLSEARYGFWKKQSEEMSRNVTMPRIKERGRDSERIVRQNRYVFQGIILLSLLLTLHALYSLMTIGDLFQISLEIGAAIVLLVLFLVRITWTVYRLKGYLREVDQATQLDDQCRRDMLISIWESSR